MTQIEFQNIVLSELKNLRQQFTKLETENKELQSSLNIMTTSTAKLMVESWSTDEAKKFFKVSYPTLLKILPYVGFQMKKGIGGEKGKKGGNWKVDPRKCQMVMDGIIKIPEIKCKLKINK